MILVPNTERTGREADAYYVTYADLGGGPGAAMFTEAEVRAAVERAAKNPEDVPEAPEDVAALVAAILAQAPVFDVQTAEGVYRVRLVPEPDGSIGINCKGVDG